MSQGRNLQYAVIGRLKKEHDAYGLDPDQICQLIATELLGYVNENDVMYVSPNYIICLDNALAQEAVLSEPTMHTNHFQLQMVAWCREHEWAQLPWISVPETEGSKVIVDPLQILPIVNKKKVSQGTQRLKDTFAAVIPTGYDLRAPDFSYLMITELQEFYESKFGAFIESKQIAYQIRSILHTFIPEAEKMLPVIIEAIKPNNNIGTSTMPHDQQVYITELRHAIHSTRVHLPRLLELADSAVKHVDTCLNLQGFKEGPPALQIAVPSTYADRLKVIYQSTIKKIHCTTPIIETVKREENRFETYVTIDDFTRRYYGAHTKNAAGMEAAAIFYALKRLTNVQGYRIIDLNYPVLHRLVSDIDGWNKRINIFQLFSTIGFDELERINEAVARKCDPKYLRTLNVRDLGSLIVATKKLTDALEHFHLLMMNLLQNLQTAKETYAGIKVGTYSPTKSVYHWGRADRPSTSSTTP